MEEHSQSELGIGSQNPGMAVPRISLLACLSTALAFVEVWAVEVPHAPDVVTGSLSVPLGILALKG